MRALTYEHVKKEFENRGWELLEERYVKSQAPMRCKCDQGHETTITWNNFQRGQGCKFCAGNVQYSYEDVKRMFEEAGCVLLADKYINFQGLLDYKCKCGTIGKTRLSHLQSGGFCKECKKTTLSNLNRTDEEEIKQMCEKNGCKFISSSMTKGKTRIKFICKCGLESEAYYCNFIRCPNCWECGKTKKSGSNCYMWNPDREAVAKNKYWRKACGRVVRRCLKKINTPKTDRTCNILGYTPNQLRDHIINHPNGVDTSLPYHIDHIFPVQAFINHGILDLQIINCLENLQPLPGPENLSKADNYDEKLFLEWLNKYQEKKDE